MSQFATYNAQYCPKLRRAARKVHVAAFGRLAAAGYAAIGVCEAGGYRRELRQVPGYQTIQPAGSPGRCALLIRDGVRVHTHGSYRLHGRKYVGHNVPGARVTGWTKPRDILWALIEEPDTGKLVVVAVWHPVPGQSHSKRARALLALEVRRAAAWMAVQTYPVDLMGDTNGAPRLALFGPLRRLAEPAFAVSRAGARIDGHWVKGGHATAAALDGYPSDHKPVVADITFGVAPHPTPAPAPTPTPGPQPPKEQPVTTYGLDESHYQHDLSIIGDHLVGQGYQFFIPKASEGATYIDPDFWAKWQQIKAAGALGAAYHFLSKSPATKQADNCVKALHGDRSIRIMIDCEAYGATLADAHAFRAEMQRRGFQVTLLYLPHWYWQQIGSPALTGWNLVSSAYPSSAHAYGSALYPGDHGSGWAAYGGVTPTLWQFASSGEVTGYSGNVDLDAFRGSLAQLRALQLFTDFAPQPAPAQVPAPARKPALPSVNVRAGRRIRRAAKGAGPKVAALLRRIANRRIQKG